jgi:hypothetical protein
MFLKEKNPEIKVRFSFSYSSMTSPYPASSVPPFNQPNSHCFEYFYCCQLYGVEPAESAILNGREPGDCISNMVCFILLMLVFYL